MEIPDNQALCFNSKGMQLEMEYTRSVKAKGIVRECKCGCMNDRSDWDYYQLKCGHYFHTRCLRHWLSSKEKLNCPLCGDLPETYESQFCSHCKRWGHFGDYECPTLLWQAIEDGWGKFW